MDRMSGMWGGGGGGSGASEDQPASAARLRLPRPRSALLQRRRLSAGDVRGSVQLVGMVSHMHALAEK